MYMIIWPILALLFIALVVAGQIILRKKLGDRLKRAKQIRIKKISEATLEGKKKKYIGELIYIESDLVNNRITIRTAYHKMSRCIRGFVRDVTGLNVDKYTLSEITSVGIPNLTNLVREYYEPEFARETRTDVRGSIMRTRMTIEGWRK
ncbi:hypothetical protein SAMN06297422_11677 [Lachnospiraceae bacterium]|nr:hypothetical protein SAMN06297422_11677 [Lachnospiraceae bacterium]